MAVGDAYLTAEDYKRRYRKIDGTRDEVLDACLTACTRVFERETGQFFGIDAAVVARVFIAQRSDCLELDYEGACPGIATTTGLEIKVDMDGDDSFADETAWEPTDYDLYPLNADKGPEPLPWDRIVVRRNSSKRFVIGNKVQVTAKFGWPAVPEAVKQDVAELCSIWLGENPRASGQINELDQVTTASPMAMSLVKRFRDAYASKVTF